jgi:hypothetical protein
LAWKIGKGNKVRIGMDPWPGSNRKHLLPQVLIERLHLQGVYYLSQIVDPTQTTIWSQGWLTVDHFGLEGDMAESWRAYINGLKTYHVRITIREDELIWKHSPFGVYTLKEGYTLINVEKMKMEPNWWWKEVWKIKCPLKARIFLWCLLKKKVPTWDRMKIKNLEGPGWCMLCKNVEESSFHMFMEFPFTIQVWKEVSARLEHGCIWQGPSIEDSWKDWSASRSNENIKAIPLLIMWGVWLARNVTIFKDTISSLDHIVIHCLDILSHFPQRKIYPLQGWYAQKKWTKQGRGISLMEQPS